MAKVVMLDGSKAIHTKTRTGVRDLNSEVKQLDDRQRDLSKRVSQCNVRFWNVDRRISDLVEDINKYKIALGVQGFIDVLFICYIIYHLL